MRSSLSEGGGEAAGAALEINVVGGLAALEATATKGRDAHQKLRQGDKEKIKRTCDTGLDEMSEKMPSCFSRAFSFIRDESEDAEREGEGSTMIKDDHSAIARRAPTVQQDEEKHRSDQALERTPAHGQEEYPDPF